MCLCVYAAGYGDDKGTHLSVFLHVMKGPRDDELTWPLRVRKFEIKLLNQISDSDHHSRTATYNNDDTPSIHTSRVTECNRSKDGRGHPQYNIIISNKDLNKITSARQFLKDDCFFLQVTEL